MKILTTLFIVLMVCHASIAEPNDVQALQEKIDNYKKTIEDQQHTIEVAKKNIKKLQKQITELEEQNKQQQQQLNLFADSTPVRANFNQNSLAIGGAYEIPQVMIISHLENGDFLASLYRRYTTSQVGDTQITAAIRGFDVSQVADGQIKAIEKPLRITGMRKYTSVVGSENTIFLFEPITWEEVTFVKANRKNQSLKN